MLKSIFLLTLLSFLFSPTLKANIANEFPGRAEFPDIKIYTKQRLNNDFDNVVVVDARSNYEFETIHINNAINIPVASKDFVDRVKQVRGSSNKKIVFYCNGRTCFKSYKAATIALESNIKNVYAYDAGMFEWAKTYPNKTTLLGKSPINPADILDKSTLKSHMLTPIKFSEMAYNTENKSSIIDIRDVMQRANSVGYFTGMERWVSLNNKSQIIKLIRNESKKDKTLLIYDAVGKQVRWLQYTLEKEKIKNYFFMEKGADGFYNQIINVKR